MRQIEMAEVMGHLATYTTPYVEALVMMTPPDLVVEQEAGKKEGATRPEDFARTETEIKASKGLLGARRVVRAQRGRPHAGSPVDLPPRRPLTLYQGIGCTMSQVGGHLTIGELAKRARVSVQTLRFYERTGLLPDPGRGASGSREYGPEMVARVRFVRAAKEVGFSLDEIGELLSLRVRRGASCARVKQSAQAKVDAIDERMKRLRIVRRVLVRLVVACSGDRAVEDCAILGALERDLA